MHDCLKRRGYFFAPSENSHILEFAFRHVKSTFKIVFKLSNWFHSSKIGFKALKLVSKLRTAKKLISQAKTASNSSEIGFTAKKQVSTIKIRLGQKIFHLKLDNVKFFDIIIMKVPFTKVFKLKGGMRGKNFLPKWFFS